jgi:amino acid transporter
MTLAKIFARHPGTPQVGHLLATVIWQFSGFDSVAALSGETENPRRNFPIAMFATVLLGTGVYLLTAMAGLSAEPNLNAWGGGAFARVARDLVGGEWLGVWICAAGAGSALSLLNVALSCTGRELWAGATLDASPMAGFFSRMTANCKGEPLPLRAVLFMAIMTIPLQFTGFGFLLDWSAFLGAVSQIIQVAIFIALRLPSATREGEQELLDQDAAAVVVETNLDDKFIVAGGWPVAVVLSLALVGSCLFLIVVTGWRAMLAAVAFVVAMFAAKALDVAIRLAINRIRGQ